ncbi:hypothetical protein H8K38_16860 [Undibacterium sp. FT79W]|jgi:hypothetical protein|uniref:hypothetical protein n=1 Tax=Undibacterium sp. FT79W TaxID=2762296 RepID=UPI00164B679C|nr:hypothetical protein [Undibacterium sp. FT79W]MBC3879482.1 hypothetical protein [Undibacterium sp. FT79W]
MNIPIKKIQVGWEITVSSVDCDNLSLTTNAGAISVESAGDGQRRLSTLDKDQFERWCSKLSNAKRPFKFVKPDGQ